MASFRLAWPRCCHPQSSSSHGVCIGKVLFTLRSVVSQGLLRHTHIRMSLGLQTHLPFTLVGLTTWASPRYHWGQETFSCLSRNHLGKSQISLGTRDFLMSLQESPGQVPDITGSNRLYPVLLGITWASPRYHWARCLSRNHLGKYQISLGKRLSHVSPGTTWASPRYH